MTDPRHMTPQEAYEVGRQEATRRAVELASELLAYAPPMQPLPVELVLQYIDKLQEPAKAQAPARPPVTLGDYVADINRRAGRPAPSGE